MVALNFIVGVLGLVGWLWVWVRSHYQTDADPRTQWGVIGLGAVWALLILADTVQDLQPTGGTILARVGLLISLWLLKPLLEKDK